MTYGADFRPGSKCLPRHDTFRLPAIEVYEAYVSSLSKLGRMRDFPSAQRIRRVCQMVANGNSLREACRLTGNSYTVLRRVLLKMPPELKGPAA